MQGGGMIGLWNTRGTGTPWFMQFLGMIPAGWEVHKCSLYSLYKPLFSHSYTDKQLGYEYTAFSSTASLYLFICHVRSSSIQVNK